MDVEKIDRVVGTLINGGVGVGISGASRKIVGGGAAIGGGIGIGDSCITL